jgi:hypothetical protein
MQAEVDMKQKRAKYRTIRTDGLPKGSRYRKSFERHSDGTSTVRIKAQTTDTLLNVSQRADLPPDILINMLLAEIADQIEKGRHKENEAPTPDVDVQKNQKWED